MRPKIVILMLLAGFAGLVGIFFLKRLTTPVLPTPPAIASQAVAPAAPPITTPSGNPVPAKPVTTIAHDTTVVPRVAADTNALAEKHEAYVQAQIDKLNELEANDDADSLHAILSELTNSDKEIRTAAVESTIQFGSRDAIPVLKALATHTEDPDEIKDLLDAADFLALPTMTEVHEQSRQAKMQNAAPVQP